MFTIAVFEIGFFHKEKYKNNEICMRRKTLSAICNKLCLIYHLFFAFQKNFLFIYFFFFCYLAVSLDDDGHNDEVYGKNYFFLHFVAANLQLKKY